MVDWYLICHQMNQMRIISNADYIILIGFTGIIIICRIAVLSKYWNSNLIRVISQTVVIPIV